MWPTQGVELEEGATLEQLSQVCPDQLELLGRLSFKRLAGAATLLYKGDLWPLRYLGP